MAYDAVAIVSGGMDSTVLAHHLVKEQDVGRLLMVSFNYGQRHQKEIVYAAAQAQLLNATHMTIPMQFLGSMLHASVLTDLTTEVPDGHYSDQTMKATVVPNRNMIMLSIAAGIAVAEQAAFVATAVHAGDHFIYPDCRPEFIDAMNLALLKATADGFGNWSAFGPIYAPFVQNTTKADIARAGYYLDVDFSMTWSCYKGGEVHCGRCGTCVERKEAFREVGVEDPTDYADPSYLIEANQHG